MGLKGFSKNVLTSRNDYDQGVFFNFAAYIAYFDAFELVYENVPGTFMIDLYINYVLTYVVYCTQSFW
jgi:hypothetical protein